jgi:hypothetical protein
LARRERVRKAGEGDVGGDRVGKAVLLPLALLRSRVLLIVIGFAATVLFAYLAVRDVDLMSA